MNAAYLTNQQREDRDRKFPTWELVNGSQNTPRPHRLLVGVSCYVVLCRANISRTRQALDEQPINF